MGVAKVEQKIRVPGSGPDLDPLSLDPEPI